MSEPTNREQTDRQPQEQPRDENQPQVPDLQAQPVDEQDQVKGGRLRRVVEE